MQFKVFKESNPDKLEANVNAWLEPKGQPKLRVINHQVFYHLDGIYVASFLYEPGAAPVASMRPAASMKRPRTT